MSSLVDQEMLKLINDKGCALNLGDRMEILAEYKLPTDKRAENVIISGCVVLFRLPRILRSFANVLEDSGVSYTFLSEEYCCGNYLYRPAIKARDDKAIKECRVYSKQFIGRNIVRAKNWGQKG